MTVTFSPFFLPSSARPTGLSLLIRPSVGLASVEPIRAVVEGFERLSERLLPKWAWAYIHVRGVLL